MNYKKIYDSLILKAKKLNRKKSKTFYLEQHHVIPKCLKPENTKENLVMLTAKEHFIAHKLLVEIYPDNSKLWYALSAMMHYKSKHTKRNYIISSREFDRVKKIISIKKSIEQTGKKHTEETKSKMRGVIRSEEYKIKLSNSLKGKSKSEEHKNKLRKPRLFESKLKGKKLTKEHVDKVIKTKTLKGNLNSNTKESIEKALATKKLNPFKHTIETLAKQKASRERNGSNYRTPESIAKRVATRKANKVKKELLLINQDT